MNAVPPNRSKPLAPCAPNPRISAFPVLSVVGQNGIETSQGMELRDYFAASVMGAIERRWPLGHKDGWDGMAAIAYGYADAMVRVRGRQYDQTLSKGQA